MLAAIRQARPSLLPVRRDPDAIPFLRVFVLSSERLTSITAPCLGADPQPRTWAMLLAGLGNIAA